ncbi:MAG: hypothetical protein KBF76_12430 [Verrucomicrobiales bacterium]|nr:hypothetical protein [Verrucomicrobiales bacterium]
MRELPLLSSFGEVDTRTPEEVIQSIAEQGKIVNDALDVLRNLLGA